MSLNLYLYVYDGFGKCCPVTYRSRVASEFIFYSFNATRRYDFKYKSKIQTDLYITTVEIIYTKKLSDVYKCMNSDVVA